VHITFYGKTLLKYGNKLYMADKSAMGALMELDEESGNTSLGATGR